MSRGMVAALLCAAAAHAQDDLITKPKECGTCAAGEECDTFTGECVAVSCKAASACPGQRCVPETVFCFRAPCPQLRCEETQPAECELPKGWTQVGTPETCPLIDFVCAAGQTHWGSSKCGCGCRPEGVHYLVEQDFRRCASPWCGGFWLTAVNSKETECADGSTAERCYVARAEGAVFQLDVPKQLVKGTQVLRTIFGSRIGSLVLDVDFDQASSSPGTGIFLSVVGKRATALNKPDLSATLSGVSFASGLDEKLVAYAKERLTAGQEVVLAGTVRRYWGGRYVLSANQIYRPSA